MELKGYKATDLGIIPDDWEVEAAHEFATIKTGPFGTLLKASEYSRDDGVPVVSVGEIQQGFLRITSQTPRAPERVTRRLPQYLLREGDIVFARKGGVNRSAPIRRVEEGWFLGSDGIIIRPSTGRHSEYVARQLQGSRVQAWLLQHAIGTTMPSLNQAVLREVAIPFPPTLAEQEAIERALVDVDALIESIEQLLDQKRQIKQGAMHELLTGKTRLPGFSDEWETKPLGELGRWTGGMTPSMQNPAYWQPGTVPWVASGDVKTARLTSTALSISNDAVKAKAATLIPARSILLVTRSGILRRYLPVSLNMIPMAINQDIKALLPHPEVLPEYLMHSLTCNGDRIRARCLKSGTTVESVEFSWLKAFTVPVPPLPEQAAVDAVLSDMDFEIAALEVRLAKTREIKQGMMQELLTGRIPTRMSTVGQSERATQNRVIRLFEDQLGYRYLKDWSDRYGNSNIEEGLLSDWLNTKGYTPEQISTVLYRLRTEASNHSRTLYGNNQAVYSLLRYGVGAKTEAGKNTETVHLIDWDEPENNDFAIAEEVTLKGNLERRPDLVLYVNGIALGVMELKNSRVSIGDGIRQLLSNQQKGFNEWFFSTVQIVFAGNDSEGMKYGTIGTSEKYFLTWKEDVADDSGYKLDKYLAKMCSKARLLELIHDFVLFDAGVKKLPRVHQYVGVKAAQGYVTQKKGGIIWHTQGSGKSIVMVLLAKWILENNPDARVAIITDRDELDRQIEGVFTQMGEPIKRTTSGHELMAQLAQSKPRLLCSLVHKFGAKNVDDFEAFMTDLEAQPSKTIGEVYVFVDECHRTQSGRLNRAMKAVMPNAVFIGFTGTPLLAKDRATSLEVFGGYIHTYKFSEGVEDGVVLDLIYEARDIDQHLGSEEKVDAWFEAKTRALNDWQRDELKKRWGTMQMVLSSASRMDRVVSDIVFDFSVKPRLSNERGNADPVASSIYDACKYFALFQKTPFKGKCAVVTSYNPMAKDVTLEETGANTESEKQFIYNIYAELLKDIDAKPGMSKTEAYEEWGKSLFIKEPANMKLLVVVDKLLTGFDAPPCTYLYIDKKMQDHGLFQAICRVNRLDTDDKVFGYIVDYKDLFKKVENAIAVYTSELDHSAPGVGPDVLLKDRLKQGRERLDSSIESLALLCEPVEPPKGELEHIHYFCGNTEMPADLQEREPLRAALYKATASLVRSYADIADELEDAGFGPAEVARLKEQLNHYLSVREIIRRASGESLDLKAYEADMRHLIDTYIEADEPKVISPFDDIGLLELIVNSGIADAISAQLGGLKGNKDAVAETIENNVRRKIVREHLNDPAFYGKMSALLDEIIAARRVKAIEYQEYLKRIADLVNKVEAGQAEGTPAALDTFGKRALFNNLRADGLPEDAVLALALNIDQAVKMVRPDDWRGVQAREQVVKRALYDVLQDEAEVERIFPIIKAQAEY